MAGVFSGASRRGVRMLCATRAPLRQDVGATRGESRCLRRQMLRTRILTAAILACILLAGLFLLPPPWAVVAVGAGFTIGACGGGGVRGLPGPAARPSC